MASALLLKIQEDTKDAMRAKNSALLGTIRLLLAAIKQKEVDERIALDDSQVISIIDKMIRQRQDSIEQYQKGNRQDLADKEAAEIAILEKYMPQALSPTEVENLILEAITATNASSIKDMSKVMAHIKAKASGRVDMGKVGTEIKVKLEKKS